MPIELIDSMIGLLLNRGDDDAKMAIPTPWIILLDINDLNFES